VTFADVAGADEAKGELTEIVDFLRMPERFRRSGPGCREACCSSDRRDRQDAARTIGGRRGRRSLLQHHGVGVRRAVRRGRRVAGPRPVRQAKKTAPSIVFVDEIDAVGPAARRGLGGGNDEREQTLNQLLAEMDGFDAATSVIVIAATNRPDVLDKACSGPAASTARSSSAIRTGPAARRSCGSTPGRSRSPRMST
jgi:cell division protease FtsH